MDTLLLSLVLAFLIGAAGLQNLAALLNVKGLRAELPAEFHGSFDRERYRQSQRYTTSRTKLGVLSSGVNLLILVLFILAGGFPWLHGLVASFELPWLATGLLFLGLLALAQDVIDLPFELYHTFRLEQSFGFNRMSPVTFITDKIKTYGLSLIIGVPIMAGILLFFRSFPQIGWLYAWGLVAVVSLALQYLGPRFILPLFNTFRELEEGELRSRIEEYARRVGFDVAGIFVMDGSKRTSKSNAFFTGLGRKKRIALFDTLLEKHAPSELLAVLAHEVGHFKLGHITKSMALNLVKMGLLLWLLSLFIAYEPLYRAFGLESTPLYAGLVFFFLLYTPLSLVLTLGINALSRRFEFQADAFAAQTTGRPGDLIKALKRLSTDNLSNLTPHPLLVLLEYSHPPVLQRIQALRALEKA